MSEDNKHALDSDTVFLQKQTPKQPSNNFSAKKHEEKEFENFQLKTTKNIKNIIIKARNAQNLTRKDIAQKINIQEKDMKDIEEGKMLYSKAPLSKLEKVLQVKLRGRLS